MFMRLCLLCFFQSDGGSGNAETVFNDQFKNFLVNVFCIILPIDQITAIIGFAVILTILLYYYSFNIILIMYFY